MNQTVKKDANLPGEAAIDPKALKIGQRVAFIRSFSPNYTKRDFAGMLGVDQSVWSKYENGKRTIPRHVAEEMANKTRVTLEFIYRGIAVGLPEVWKARLLDTPGGSDLLEPTDRL